MNPILSAALGSILRHVLTMGATYLVAQGIWTESDATVYVTAGAMGILGVGWAVWQKYRAHHKVLQALDMPEGSSLEDMKRP